MQDLFHDIHERLMQIHSYIEVNSMYNQSPKDDEETFKLMSKIALLASLLKELQTEINTKSAH